MVFVCRYRPASLEWLVKVGWYPGKTKKQFHLCVLSVSVVNLSFCLNRSYFINAEN